MASPVEMVQEWLTAIGETTYDPDHRERLMWEELDEARDAMRQYHAVISDSEERWPSDKEPWLSWHREALIAIARELCDLAYVAIGTALVQYPNQYWGGITLRDYGPTSAPRWMIEEGLYELFSRSHATRSIRKAAAYYGIGDKLEACFAEVHRANMAKLECEECRGWGILRESVPSGICAACDGTGRHVRRSPDGKILKPKHWQPPDLGPILFPEAK